jgi:hypothetical protein
VHSIRVMVVVVPWLGPSGCSRPTLATHPWLVARHSGATSRLRVSSWSHCWLAASYYFRPGVYCRAYHPSVAPPWDDRVAIPRPDTAIAQSLSSLGQYEEAAHHFNMAAEVDPTDERGALHSSSCTGATHCVWPAHFGVTKPFACCHVRRASAAKRLAGVGECKAGGAADARADGAAGGGALLLAGPRRRAKSRRPGLALAGGSRCTHLLQ